MESEFKTNIYKGNQILPFLSIIADFRMKYFRDFPYMYAGNLEYESHYIRGYASDPRSLLVTIEYNNRIIAIATALPLLSEADILKDSEKLFIENNYDAAKIFYLGEIIVIPEFQHQKKSRILINEVEKYAKENSFTQICFSTVIRDSSDKRKPKDYNDSKHVWNAFGYHQINLKIDYEWPTINEDGKVNDTLNPMEFWLKIIP